MNAKKIVLFSIISALAVIPRCSTGGSSDATSGFDVSGSDLPSELVTASAIPAITFTKPFSENPASTLTGTKQYAAVVYRIASSPTPQKLGLVLGEYSSLGKMKYKIILTFDDSWPSTDTTNYPNALPSTNTAQEVPHTLTNGTATLLLTEKDGQAPRCYTLRNLAATAKIKYKDVTVNFSSTNAFYIYTVTFDSSLVLNFPRSTIVCTLTSVDAVGG